MRDEMKKPMDTEDMVGGEATDARAVDDFEDAVDAKMAAELAMAKDAYLRTAAEMDNMRKRNIAEMESARKFAVQSFVKDLLPVVDNLERALAAEGSDKVLREGVDMVRSQLMQALARVGVEKVQAEAGMDPNPELHQVMQVAPCDGVQAGKIGAVMQPGYALHGRLVRPALIVVAE